MRKTPWPRASDENADLETWNRHSLLQITVVLNTEFTIIQRKLLL